MKSLPSSANGSKKNLDSPLVAQTPSVQLVHICPYSKQGIRYPSTKQGIHVRFSCFWDSVQSLRHIDWNSSIVVLQHTYVWKQNIVGIQVIKVVILAKRTTVLALSRSCAWKTTSQVRVCTFRLSTQSSLCSNEAFKCFDGESYMRGRICQRVVPMIRFQSTDSRMAKKHSGPWWNGIKIHQDFSSYSDLCSSFLH